MASANPNTSRSQPLAWDIGVRKKPSDARGPKLNSEIIQPHATITAGAGRPMVAGRGGGAPPAAVGAGKGRQQNRHGRTCVSRSQPGSSSQGSHSCGGFEPTLN